MTVESYPDLRRAMVPEMRDLAEAAPAVMKGLGTMHRASGTDGALSATTKHLMALAIGIAEKCDGCIAFHMRDAIDAGATDEEIHETIGVAVMMGGGPASIYGAEALRALSEFRGDAG